MAIDNIWVVEESRYDGGSIFEIYSSQKAADMRFIKAQRGLFVDYIRLIKYKLVGEEYKSESVIIRKD